MSRKRQINIRQDQYRSHGAFTNLQNLLDQRHAAKSLELAYQSRSRLGMSGSHLSKTKGRGVDFEEFRAYQPGDDIRSIDWRVTARTGRPFTKVFREEKEKPVIIAVDQSHNMFFGSQVAFKSVIAAETAAILCWSTVDNGDRVGGVVFSDQQQELVKPRRSKRSALRLLNTICDFNQRLVDSHKQHQEERVDTHLLRALEQMHRIAKPGSDVYIISDFRGLNEASRQYLHQLAVHNTVTAIFIYDILEENLPAPGFYSITDGLHKSALNTHARSVRHLYHEDFKQRLAELEAEFNRMKIPLLVLRTDQVVLEQLQAWQHLTH